MAKARARKRQALTPSQWERVKQVFAEAAKLDESSRAAYLKGLGKNENPVRQEVESLLAHHDPGRDFLDVHSSVGSTVLAHYEVGEQIGQGGMGLVYRARDRRLDRWVALKLLPPWAVAHPHLRQRLLREAQCASALDHPNIVTVHGIEQDRGVDFIVMEYVHGKTLQSLIPARGLPVKDALHFGVQIAEALSAAYAKGILHGDLKPLNIMVTEDRRVKLLDFGLAAALSSADPQSGEAEPPERFGTRVYMAPEQLDGLHPDPRSEIFSLGLILHQMLGGKHAFGPGGREETVTAMLTKAPRHLPERVPASVVNLVYRCLQKNPAERPASMQEVLFELKNCRARESGPEEGADDAIPSDEVRRVRAIARRIGYDSIARSRTALTDLERLLKNASPQVRGAAASVLREVILTVDQGRTGLSDPVREVRKLTLDALRACAPGGLAECFQDRGLEHLDLYGMNFAGERLTGMSFQASFLVAASFQKCDLRGATFAGAWIRNGNFAEADLSGADMTDADWFNALGLTENQLRSIRPHTLLDCPADIPAMHHYLAARYVYPFESWSTQIQEEIKAAWNEYLRPGGLRDLAAGRRKAPG